MRLSITQTLWITLLTLASLLVSGFVSASVGMDASMQHRPLQSSHEMMISCSGESSMPAPVHHAMGPEMPQHHGMTVSHMSQSEADTDSVHSVSCDSANNIDMGHTCCDTTCTNVPAVLSGSCAISFLSSVMMVAPTTATGSIINRVQTLYRPPIA